MQSPGPSDYNPDISVSKKKSPQYGLRGRDLEPPIAGKEVPGPGSYYQEK